MSKYKKDKIVVGNVVGIEKYGVFVGLDEYYNGLIHISEISNGFVKDISEYVEVGETIKVKIIEMDNDSFKLKLSIKDIDYRINKKVPVMIKETPHGFDTLKNSLSTWIKYKLEEIKKINN